MINAGTETSSVTIEWALSALMNHPKVLLKAQQELNTDIGRERLVEESDVPKLKYLQTIVKETLRLYPPVPLLFPHESIEACSVGARYHVPAGTQLFVNAWASHQNSALWERPMDFILERFLNVGKEMDVKGHDFELISFGSGRIICPGMSLALIVVSHTLGRLLQSFEWTAPRGSEINMREGLGLTMPKLIPLEAL